MSEVTISSIKCPFVPNHVVPYDRFLNHIEKCKFPGKVHFTKCRFNPYHIIHKDYIVSHQKECTQRDKYKPLEDDQEDWWGADQKPQKIQTPEPDKKQNEEDSSSDEDEQNELKSEEQEVYQKKSKYEETQAKKVEIQDFDSLDFGYQGI